MTDNNSALYLTDSTPGTTNDGSPNDDDDDRKPSVIVPKALKYETAP